MIFWLRFLLIGCFSLTAFSLFLFQGIEIVQAFLDLFHTKRS